MELNVPAGTSSGRKFRLKGKGMGSSKSRGDLFVKAMIKVPSQPGAAEKELWEKLAETSTFNARA